MTRTRALVGAGVATSLAAALPARLPGAPTRWQRTNYRGRQVSLVNGPVLAVAAAASCRTSWPAALAAAGAGLVGAYDDAVGDLDQAKGLRGHAAALRQGRLTAGSIKVLGVSAAALAATVAGGARAPRDALLGGAVVAGSANLVNLLDLRPGRALKAGALAAGLLGEPGVGGACLALLPADLAEEAMLGDAGANALGAVLGVSLLRVLPGRFGRGMALAGLVLLTAASERVSFSAVIDRTPALRALDRLGRRP